MILATLFVTTSAIAETRVKLNIEKSKEFIAEFSACQDNAERKDKKIIVLDKMVAVEKQRSDNFSIQYDKCDENFKIKEIEANEWKKEYTECTEDSINCGELPWWKIDFKSMSIGAIIALILIG